MIGGPGLEPGVKAGLPADIDIDATKAGDAPLEVEVLNPQNKKVKVEIDEEEPGIFAATYYPEKPGKEECTQTYSSRCIVWSSFGRGGRNYVKVVDVIEC